MLTWALHACALPSQRSAEKSLLEDASQRLTLLWEPERILGEYRRVEAPSGAGSRTMPGTEEAPMSEETLDRVLRATTVITTNDGAPLASGVFVSPGGLIATNWHVAVHCAKDLDQHPSTISAQSPREELPCPDLQAWQLIGRAVEASDQACIAPAGNDREAPSTQGADAASLPGFPANSGDPCSVIAGYDSSRDRCEYRSSWRTDLRVAYAYRPRALRVVFLPTEAEAFVNATYDLSSFGTAFDLAFLRAYPIGESPAASSERMPRFGRFFGPRGGGGGRRVQSENGAPVTPESFLPWDGWGRRGNSRGSSAASSAPMNAAPVAASGLTISASYPGATWHLLNEGERRFMQAHHEAQAQLGEATLNALSGFDLRVPFATRANTGWHRSFARLLGAAGSFATWGNLQSGGAPLANRATPMSTSDIAWMQAMVLDGGAIASETVKRAIAREAGEDVREAWLPPVYPEDEDAHRNHTQNEALLSASLAVWMMYLRTSPAAFGEQRDFVLKMLASVGSQPDQQTVAEEAQTVAETVAEEAQTVAENLLGDASLRTAFAEQYAALLDELHADPTLGPRLSAAHDMLGSGVHPSLWGVRGPGEEQAFNDASAQVTLPTPAAARTVERMAPDLRVSIGQIHHAPAASPMDTGYTTLSAMARELSQVPDASAPAASAPGTAGPGEPAPMREARDRAKEKWRHGLSSLFNGTLSTGNRPSTSGGGEGTPWPSGGDDPIINFTSSNVAVRGCSGSAVVNASAEVIGIVFNTNDAGVMHHYKLDVPGAAQKAVHSGGALLVLERVFGAHALAQELRADLQ